MSVDFKSACVLSQESLICLNINVGVLQPPEVKFRSALFYIFPSSLNFLPSSFLCILLLNQNPSQPIVRLKSISLLSPSSKGGTEAQLGERHIGKLKYRVLILYEPLLHSSKFSGKGSGAWFGELQALNRVSLVAFVRWALSPLLAFKTPATYQASLGTNETTFNHHELTPLTEV